MQDKIKQSLHELSAQGVDTYENQHNISKYVPHTRYQHQKSTSFTELSDWSNHHSFRNQSIILPRLFHEQQNARSNSSVEIQSNLQSERQRLRNQKSWEIKPVSIKFGPPAQKAQRKSILDKYSQDKKLHRITPSEYISLHEIQKQKKREKEVSLMDGQGTVLNRVVGNRKKLKKHFLEQYLIASKMAFNLKKENQC